MSSPKQKSQKVTSPYQYCSATLNGKIYIILDLLVHVGSLTLSCMQSSCKHGCVKFGYFLLLKQTNKQLILFLLWSITVHMFLLGPVELITFLSVTLNVTVYTLLLIVPRDCTVRVTCLR